MRHRERERAFGARPRGDPLVRVHARQRQAGPDVDELRHRGRPPGIERVRASEAVLEFDGGEPCVEKVGAERQEILGVREVVGGQRRGPERQAIAGAQRIEAEGLVAQPPAADLPHPLIDQVAERGHFGTREEHDALAARLAHLDAEPLNGAIPIDRFERAFGVADLRADDAIGIVQSLECRLPPGTEAAAVDRRLGIALELHRAAFAHAHLQAAARSALATCRRVIRRRPRDLILWLDQIRNQFFRGLGADAARGQRGRAGAAHAEDLEESPAIHAVGHGASSNDTRCNRVSPCVRRDSARTTPCAASRPGTPAPYAVLPRGTSRTTARRVL